MLEAMYVRGVNGYRIVFCKRVGGVLLLTTAMSNDKTNSIIPAMINR